MRKNTTHIGSQAEQRACLFLQQQGLRIVTHNYRCRLGEIDLIMDDHRTLVFIEVRYRQHTQFGNSIDSIHYGKQQKIIRTAEFYLQQHRLSHHVPCRFDVIGFCADLTAPPTWIKNAFTA